jgi:ABC-2 type transport system ATP-binding protein
VEQHLKRFDLLEYRKKKIKTLSKGMQQKAQIIATIVHRPDLLLIDEPFTALDPLNVQMVKDLMRDLRRDGVTIIMSTHQMNQVEELCDRILLINHGRAMLYGGLDEVRRRFSGHAVLVRAPGDLDGLPGVVERVDHRDFTRLNLAAHVSPDDILRALVARGTPVEKFEIALPSLDEIFIRVVEQGLPQ